MVVLICGIGLVINMLYETTGEYYRLTKNQEEHGRKGQGVALRDAEHFQDTPFT